MNDLPASPVSPESSLNNPASLVERPDTFGGVGTSGSLTLFGVVSVELTDPVFRKGSGEQDAFCIQRVEIRTVDGGFFTISMHRVIAERPFCEICGSTGDYTECAECAIPF